MAFWNFDKDGAVLKYDAWIPNLSNWVASTNGVSLTNQYFQAASIQQLCAATQQRCTGANTQWTSFDDCVTQLTMKTYGDYNEAWGDNIVCRTIHVVLTQVRPDVSLTPCSLPQFLARTNIDRYR